MPIDEFRSTRTVSRVTRVLLIANVATNTAYLLTTLVQANWFPGIFDEDAPVESAPEIILLLWFSGVALLLFAVYAATVVAFLVWYFRSYQNLLAMRIDQLRASPAWASVSWFIPFVNLWIPLRSMNELYNDSDADLVGEVTVYSDTGTPAFHGMWWACWLISNIAGNLSFRLEMQGGSETAASASFILDVVSSFFTIVAAYLCYEIVGRITKRQEQVGEKLGLLESVPPPPPNL